MANPTYGVNVSATRETFLQSTDAKQNTYLHIVAKTAQIEALGQILPLLQPEDLNIINVDGWTPLHGAVWEGQEAVAKMLLAAGADPNIKVKLGPVTDEELEANARQRHPVAEIQLAKMRVGFTTLHFAALRQFKGLAKVLIEHNANIHEEGGAINNLVTPFSFACRKENQDFFKLFCVHGASQFVTDQQILGVREVAKTLDPELFKFFVEAIRSQPNFTLKLLEPLWHFVCQSPEMTNYFLELGVDPNNSDSRFNLAYQICNTYNVFKWNESVKENSWDSLQILLARPGPNKINQHSLNLGLHAAIQSADVHHEPDNFRNRGAYCLWLCGAILTLSLIRFCLKSESLPIHHRTTSITYSRIVPLLIEKGAQVHVSTVYLQRERFSRTFELHRVVREAAVKNGTWGEEI